MQEPFYFPRIWATMLAAGWEPELSADGGDGEQRWVVTWRRGGVVRHVGE